MSFRMWEPFVLGIQHKQTPTHTILIYFPCKTGLEIYNTPLVVNRGRVGTTIHFAMYVGLLQMSIGTHYFTQLTKA